MLCSGWRCGGVKVLPLLGGFACKVCFQRLSKISHRRHAICFLPLAAILESPLHLFWMIVLLGRVSWGSFSAWNTSLHALLILRFPLRNLLWFWWVYLCMLFFFSLIAFNVLSLCFVLVLMVICHGLVQFWSSLFFVLEGSCTWMGIAFSRFW
jgi:hypothetical protein